MASDGVRKPTGIKGLPDAIKMLQVGRMSYFTVINLPSFIDQRGGLSVLDGALPFPVKRIYWIYGSDGNKRGGHRHHKTRQALIAVHGKVIVHMDDGLNVEDIHLDSPGQCLLVEPKHWHTMNFEADAVLLVIASHPYDKDDYIDESYRQ